MNKKKIVTIQKALDDYYIKRTKTHRLKEITVTKDKARVENHFIQNLPKKENTNILDVTYNETIKVLKNLKMLIS